MGLDIVTALLRRREYSGRSREVGREAIRDIWDNSSVPFLKLFRGIDSKQQNSSSCIHKSCLLRRKTPALRCSSHTGYHQVPLINFKSLITLRRHREVKLLLEAEGQSILLILYLSFESTLTPLLKPTTPTITRKTMTTTNSTTNSTTR